MHFRVTKPQRDLWGPVGTRPLGFALEKPGDSHSRAITQSVVIRRKSIATDRPDQSNTQCNENEYTHAAQKNAVVKLMIVTVATELLKNSFLSLFGGSTPFFYYFVVEISKERHFLLLVFMSTSILVRNTKKLQFPNQFFK